MSLENVGVCVQRFNENHVSEVVNCPVKVDTARRRKFHFSLFETQKCSRQPFVGNMQTASDVKQHQ